MRLPKFPYEVERVTSFDQLSSGMMIYGFPCTRCRNKGHLFFLNKFRTRTGLLCEPHWTVIPGLCDTSRVGAICKHDIDAGRLYRIVDRLPLPNSSLDENTVIKLRRLFTTTLYGKFTKIDGAVKP